MTMQKPQRGIYERVKDSGVWWIRYADSKGTIRREKAGSLSNAKKLYSIRKSAALQNQKLPFMVKSTTKFSELAKDCLAHSKTHKKSFKSDSERMVLLVDLFGDMTVDTITHQTIEQKIDAVATDRKWTGATRNRHLALLSLTFKLAKKSKKVTTNPVHDVQKSKESLGVVRYLLPEEETRLRNVIELDYPARWATIQLHLHTGTRASELHNLKWTEVSRTTALMTLLETKNGEMRHLPLNSAALNALAILKTHDEGTGYVCPRQRYVKWFATALKHAGILNFRWHDLRHTTASRLAMSGCDLLSISRLLGHKNLKMTLRYAHLSPGFLSDAVSKLVGFGTGTTTSTEISATMHATDKAAA
jgi:site-specific recombinase XerD